MSKADSDAAVRKELRNRSRRGFITAGVAGLGTFAGLKLLAGRTDPDGLPSGLRSVLGGNEALSRSFFRDHRLSKEYTVEAAREPRVNGVIGLPDDVDLMPTVAERESWKVVVESPKGKATLSLADLKRCPPITVTTELRCIEGWTEVVSWSGVRLSDLAAMTGLARRSDQPDDLYSYVSLETPARAYYVGLDTPSAFHPQTLVADAMNGKPLSNGHGGPLRLAIPVKYGVKNLKRIALIRFGDDRPRDYWAEQGYDWYAGL